MVGDYTIGVDVGVTGKDRKAYCLARQTKSGVEILLSKSFDLKDSEAFEEEVKNLSKYFNADIV